MAISEHNDTMVYRKVDPTEIINIGDVIMIDPYSGYITKAGKGDKNACPINNRLVIGVCVNSNNYAMFNIEINGGSSFDDIEREELSSTSGDTELIYIDGGTSEQNQREIIEVAYSGEVPVNIIGFVEIGDRIGRSRKRKID